MRKARLLRFSFYALVFAFLLLFMPARPKIHAAALANGSYLDSCTGAEMHGTTLVANCTNFFGASQLASLNDADACNQSGHDIANMAGNLRCVYLWDPNGIGVLSRMPTVEKDGKSTIVWTIDWPVVNQPAFDYPEIKFKPGDAITINAGGCAQTGGSGATWKSYTNPQGDSANEFYSGLIYVPGARGILGGGLVRIGGVLGQEYDVPLGVQGPVLQNLYLHIGYQDEPGDYGDNGYYSHDNGNNNQCANVAGAWIQIKIVRPSSPEDATIPVWSPGVQPFDMISDQEDTQGLPLNPRWHAQGDHGPTQSEPNFNAACGPSFSDQENVNETYLYNHCSQQHPYTDLSQNIMDGAHIWFVDNGAHFCETDVLKGHLDWALGTVQGTVRFHGWATGGMNDDDYNFFLAGADNSLLDTLNTPPDSGPGLVLEFNSDESIHQFQDPWWAALDSAVEGLAGHGGTVTVPGNSPLGQVGSGRPGVAVGLIGVDGVHGHVESHPVFALAINTVTSEDANSVDETWEFFVRNFGNEGNCSHYVHFWDGLAGKYYVQLINPPHWEDVSDARVTSSDAYLWQGTSESGSPAGEASVVVAKDSVATYLEVALPAPSEASSNQGGWGINGTVTIHYTLKPNPSRRPGAKRDDSAPVTVNGKLKDDEADEAAIQKQISNQAAWKGVQQIFQTEYPAAQATKRPNRQLSVDAVVHEHKPPVGVHHKGLTRTVRVPDQQKVKANNSLLALASSLKTTSGQK